MATTAPAKPAATTAAAKPASTAAPQPAAKAISLPQPELRSVKFGFPTLEANSFLVKLAEDLGLYQKYGITQTESFFFEGSARLAQAQVAREVDFGSQSGGPVVSSLITDSPMVMAAMYNNKLTDDLVAASNVRSAADLRGKPIAVGGMGADAHASVLLALEALNVDTSEVNIVSIGGQSARLAALQAGSVAAAPIDQALRDQMKELGFNILVSLSESPLEFVRSGVVFSREWMERNPNTALAVVAANLEARQLMERQMDRAIDSYMNWTQNQDRAQAETAIKIFLSTSRPDLRWSEGAWTGQKEVLAQVNPAIQEADVTRAYTYELLDRLQQMGFNDAIGIPRS